jgi:hypothetical protein
MKKEQSVSSFETRYYHHPEDFLSAFTGEGDAGFSKNKEISLNGLKTAEAKAKITAWLEEKNLGKKTINYKLRDWLFSRQRYWGEPFPIVWKKDAAGNLYHEALPESSLPLLPPVLEDYKPTADGQPPLARAKDWLHLPDGAIRETNTMPQWRAVVGIISVTPTRKIPPRLSARTPKIIGCLGGTVCRRPKLLLNQGRRHAVPPKVLISTSAERSTPCCICSTRVSGTRFCSTSNWFPRRNRFSNSSIKA